MASPAGLTLRPLTAGGLLAGIAVAIVLRVFLLPVPGLAGDLTDFADWAGRIARDGLGGAYDARISFPPVLPWIWAALGAVVPAVSSGSADDPAVRIALKLPATLADLGLAAGVAFALRARPGWAAAGAIAVLLHPGTWYVSAWWGQFESLYALPLLGAFLAAVAGRRDVAAVLVAVAVMTKPQALPLAVPFGAWFLATGGVRGAGRAALVGAVTIVILWLPFLAADGPARYLANLREYVDRLFPVVSLRAWNPWWILQIASGADGLIVDSTAVAGPVTFRWLGLGAAAAVEVALVAWVVRRPSRETLAWALAATAIAVPMLLTGMHERYTYAGLVFLALLWPDRRAVLLWAAHGVLFVANLVAAVPPGTGGPGSLVPVDGFVGLVGSLGMTAVAAFVVAGARRAARG